MEEEFVKVDDIPDFNKDHKDIYQIQQKKNGYEEVKIGRMEDSANVLIKQLKYKNNILRIVNCLYTEDELNIFKSKNMIPLIEIYINNSINKKIISYCVRPKECDYVTIITEDLKSKIIKYHENNLKKDNIITHLIIESKELIL